ncbi:DUF1643 domain-containing protein [Bacillus cereus]|uniref:DUF1643 domain-containing protein n=1 Tax=Bacillus cereus TaxID=1396 RepID=UPI001595B8BD|nr:DUF1643 domain-containing protein [Bacillus cereus]MDZ4619394.1 DUF1643 domain-containing protein [Bacillus cereus]
MKIEQEFEEEWIFSRAEFNKDKTKRYNLIREWDSKKKRAAVILLNPSKANHLKSDNTVNNCMNTIIDLKVYGSVEIVNLFPIMKTKSNGLLKKDKEFDEVNFSYIQQAVKKADLIILGWGSNKKHVPDERIIKLLEDKKNLYCFGFKDYENKIAHPRVILEKMKLVKYSF